MSTHNLKRITFGTLLSGGIALASLGPATGTAQADNNGPHRWCPGQSMEWPTGPWGDALWDMNVCHTFWGVGYGLGNVPNREGVPSDVWDGDDPPPPPPGCPPVAFMCP
jgi:hypothetical protein